MSYLSGLPSCGDIKHFFAQAYHKAYDGVNQYYPVARDSAKEYGGRAVNYIKEQASEHPIAAMAAANFVLGLTIGKISTFVAEIFNKVFSKDTSKIIGFSAAGLSALAFDAYLYVALGLNPSIALGAAIVGGFGAGFMLHKQGLSNVTLAAGAGFIAGAAL